MKSTQPTPSIIWNWPRRFVATVAALFVTWASAPLKAEVSVVTDSHGRYVRTLVISDSKGGRRLYWTPIRRGIDTRLVLNPSGDRLGDGAPVTGEQPRSRQPWVIWSAADGHDREIAFATWSNGRWQGPALLERSDNAYDDLNPRLAFDSQGRPVVAWWRNEATPRIYLSIYREGAWSIPVPISDASIPSRFPSLRIQGNLAVISFSTSLGQTVLYHDLSSAAIRMDGDIVDGPNPPPASSHNPGDGGGELSPSCGAGSDCPGIMVQRPQAADGQ